MRNIKTFLALGVMAMSSLNIMADDFDAENAAYKYGYYSHPYWFLQVQAGGATTFTNGDNSKLITPTFSVAGGRMFSPVIGARIHVNGFKQKGMLHANIPSIDELNNIVYNVEELKYKYNYVNSNIDVMLNLTNLINKNYYKKANVYLIGGVGLCYAWHNNDFTAITSNASVLEDVSNAWGEGTSRKSLLSHSIRAGVMFEYDITKHFGVGAEVDINNFSDRFNSKYNNSSDWMMTAQLSFTYKFRSKKEEQQIAATIANHKKDSIAAVEEAARVRALALRKKAEADRLARIEAEKVAAAAAATAAAAKAEKEATINENIKFRIGNSDPIDNNETITNIADWCQKHTSKNITVTGYADKKTGSHKVNMKISRKRAENVANALKQKGVAAERITVEAKGDTVQPYPEDNDANRCTIVESK